MSEKYVCKNGSAICAQQMEFCDKCKDEIRDNLTPEQRAYDNYVTNRGLE